MATKLLYLEDFDVVTCSAIVQEVSATEDGRTCIILDQTCFYPRGGGQDWDMGEIKAGDTICKVDEVRLDEQGRVWHIGALSGGVFKAGTKVECIADAARRRLNTRLHSAGHVVDMAVQQLGYGWPATKGAHYPHLSFVEFAGELQPEHYEEHRAAIEAKVNQLVRTGGDTHIRFMPVSDMHTVCYRVPDNIPTNKPARVVIYNGTFGIPCGGTHVRNLRDIGAVTIPKIKCKKGTIKVSYSITEGELS